ncbi:MULTISPECIES: transcription elongation factor GreA [Sinobaca]|uniref:Transcription elongation factor GreA n=1 Tax=Sinobaca qinghaiensis TaxID=342944 RepID=A0A419V3W0_9BACL|nr:MULTISPECIES: transcription elongation factor GreA [Sinobaca]RKD73076.1 transcription elongation factor GreA [Sinobaca qinghaiensis]
MAEEKQNYMTEEGKNKLEEELNFLKTDRRTEIVERIKVARSFGDLSENSEYDAAKDEQAFVEGRIGQIENMLKTAIMIEEDKTNNSEVALGKSVTFKELPDGEKEMYTIVGSAESDPLEGKISNDSPMAQSLLGRKVGEAVMVNTPGGDIEVEIIEVS